MSAIARFLNVSRAALPELCDAAVPKKRSFFGGSKDTFEVTLKKHGREVAQYKSSGYFLAALLPYLESERNIDLMQSDLDELSKFLSEKRGGTVFFLTHLHKDAYLTELGADLSEAELGRYYDELMKDDDSGAGKPMLDGVRVLRESLATVDESSVVLLAIG